MCMCTLLDCILLCSSCKMSVTFSQQSRHCKKLFSWSQKTLLGTSPQGEQAHVCMYTVHVLVQCMYNVSVCTSPCESCHHYETISDNVPILCDTHGKQLEQSRTTTSGPNVEQDVFWAWPENHLLCWGDWKYMYVLHIMHVQDNWLALEYTYAVHAHVHSRA